MVAEVDSEDRRETLRKRKVAKGGDNGRGD